jgi:hypothetical protein
VPPGLVLEDELCSVWLQPHAAQRLASNGGAAASRGAKRVLLVVGRDEECTRMLKYALEGCSRQLLDAAAWQHCSGARGAEQWHTLHAAARREGELRLAFSCIGIWTRGTRGARWHEPWASARICGWCGELQSGRDVVVLHGRCRDGAQVRARQDSAGMSGGLVGGWVGGPWAESHQRWAGTVAVGRVQQMVKSFL